MGKYRNPFWEVALGLVRYQPGLSFTKAYRVWALGEGGEACGGVVLEKVGERELETP